MNWWIDQYKQYHTELNTNYPGNNLKPQLQHIIDLVKETIIPIYPNIKCVNTNNNCYKLLGYDILIDENYSILTTPPYFDFVVLASGNILVMLIFLVPHISPSVSLMVKKAAWHRK